MIGAILGDIVGSRFEWNNIKSKDFEFLTNACFFTDDSVMTIAIAKALLEWEKNKALDLSNLAIKYMQEIGRKYPNCGYGGNFGGWLISTNPQPYNSWGNGSAMRISPVAYVAKSLEEVKELSYKVTCVTHNHPEGLKGAEATACATYLALNGKSKDEIKKYIVDNYYKLDFTIDSIRDGYDFDVSCQGSVPQALQCFFESTSFEDCIRNCMSLGGDSDTLGAIAGAVAEAYYGIEEKWLNKYQQFLTKDLLEIVLEFIAKHNINK